MSSRIIFWLYRLLTAAVLPLTILYVVVRIRRSRQYAHGWQERFGVLPASCRRTTADAIWLHAVSVGEVLSCVPLIAELRRRLPGSPVFVSCATLAGREAAEAKLLTSTDGVFFAPFDHVFAVRRVLRTIRPAVLIILETEIWPNLWRESKRAGVGLVVANGRISGKTADKYARHRWFFRHCFAFADAILVQSETDRKRFVAAGAAAEQVRVAGNLKYDFEPATEAPSPDLGEWLDGSSGPLWIAASTVAPEFEGDVDEDDAVLAAYVELRKRYANLRLLIAPRKPERFGTVAGKLAASGVKWSRRTALDSRATVLLLDSVGELAALFPAADVVFMGGTLAHRGGHNILEPAACGRAIIVGPHLENFAEIQRHFRQGRGFVEIQTPAELGRAVEDLLKPNDYGSRAAKLAAAERGAAARAAAVVQQVRWTAAPVYANWFLRSLTAAWMAGGCWKQARDLKRQCRLPVPVISVGGISMGGTGKTPIVRWLARALRDRGHTPAVLTRGYRRADRSEAITILRSGSRSPVAVTGDEPQLLLRDGAAHVGIGSDRCEAGRRLVANFQPDVFLLDDGFQHARMHRDIDIVLIDALDPWGGGVFPAGRLREPPTALERADFIIITRSEARATDVLEQQIRHYAPRAALLRSRTVAVRWVDAFSGAETPLGRALRGAAFCALGNPESFWISLQQMQCEAALKFVFPDHHRYRLDDLQRVADAARESGLHHVFTTEKDAVKFPRSAAAVFDKLQVLVLQIDVALDRAEAIFSAIQLARRSANLSLS